MRKLRQHIRTFALLGAVSLLLSCNLIGSAYTERNENGFKPVELRSPQQGGELNRLAFGVSSREIKPGPLPKPVYTDTGVNNSFYPWGNIIRDSDDLVDPIPAGPNGERRIILTAINENNNAGKIAGSEDGISYYFKKVPADINFRLSADFYINSYGFTNGRAELNGQEAFGLMARDYVPQHTNNGGGHNLTMEALKNVRWDGIYWNGQGTSLQDGISGSSNMIMVGGVKRGMRVYWRSGVNDPDGQGAPVTDPQVIANADFAKFNYLPRELSDYSVYGTGIEGTKSRPDFPSAGLTYKLYLERTNSGFIARITPPAGMDPPKGITKNRIPADGEPLQYSDRELCFPDIMANEKSLEMYNRDKASGSNNESPGSAWLNSVNKDHYYVGFFAARDVQVTITNIRYEESPANMCSVRVDPLPELITPTLNVQSPQASSQEEYILYARSNVEGTLALSINGSEPKVYQSKWTTEPSNASAVPFSLFTIGAQEDGSDKISLKKGDNIFDMIFYPDTEQLDSGYFSGGGEFEMANYKPVAYTHIVNRRDLAGNGKFGANNYDIIWVAPNPKGQSTGDGSKERPLDIKTAIAVSGPGQVIILQDGIYTPIDPPEVFNGTVRVPIRLTIPRYNSGRPNPAASGGGGPHPKPSGMGGSVGAAPKVGNVGSGDPYYPYNDPYYKYYKVLMAENRNKAIFDFRKDLATQGYTPRAFEHYGDYWIIDGIHVRNAYDTWKGLTLSGSYNLVRWVKTYFNGDTGLQISGNNAEPKSVWPSNNRIEYCESFGNADLARTNADGFAAKLTVWEGNVFYRTISHHNIDDGYDLFAKKETGPIGALHIEQCFAYSNGRYLNDEMGYIYSEADARAYRNDSAGVGGNGFKMGGEGIPVQHLAIDCLSFGNDGDGFTSNSDPAIRLTHVSAFDNYNRLDTAPGSNFAIYSASSPSYEGLDAIITQIVSWRSVIEGKRNDRVEPRSPSSGYVWRNYDEITSGGLDPKGFILGLSNTGPHGVYDGNNGKDSAILDLLTLNSASPVIDKKLPGKSVSTQYISGRRTQLTANGNVNMYEDNRELTLADFYNGQNPADYFAYGERGSSASGINGLFTASGESTWDILDDDPYLYLRFDGSAPMYSSRHVVGDFLEVWQEGDAVDPYYWGLPKLGDFMRLKDFPGVTPGARGLWK